MKIVWMLYLIGSNRVKTNPVERIIQDIAVISDGTMVLSGDTGPDGEPLGYTMTLKEQ